MLATVPGCNPECRVCHYKDLEYSEQLKRKDAWARSRLISHVDRLSSIIPAPERDRIGARTKTWMRAHHDPEGLRFGMFKARLEEALGGEKAKWGKVFIDWRGCPVIDPSIDRSLARLARELDSKGRGAFTSLFGVWTSIPEMVLVAGSDEQLPVFQSLDWSKIIEAPVRRVSFHRVSQVGKRVFGPGPIETLYGEEMRGSAPIRAFRQNARELLQQARAAAVESLLSGNPDQVVDLYSGCGEIADLIPDELGWIGIEISRAAVDYVNRKHIDRDPNASERRAFLGLVEDRLRDPLFLGKVRERAALYLNPPRTGISGDCREAFIAFLERFKPMCLVYLSCSASSLARDLEMIVPMGYRVESLQPYDFFPQTEHFETLAVLSRELSSIE